MPDPETVYTEWQAGQSFIHQARKSGFTLASVVMAAMEWSKSL